ncbi:hypothetical protein VZO05_07215 [Aggregatilineales bacterium SYSU G02658]
MSDLARLRWEWVALAAVLFTAAALRLAYPTYVEYFHDDAMLVTLAQEMAREGRLPLTGILSSTGIPNPPASVYAMAVPFALSPDPALAVIYVMLLNVAGVGLLCALLRRVLPLSAALTGAALYAVSPWAIWYSRKIWAQDFHTPFLLLSLVLLLYGLTTRHRWLQALALPVGVFAVQIHFAAWALLPIYPLALIAYRRSLSWRALFSGLLLSAAVVTPYALGLWDTLQTDPTRITDALNRAPHSADDLPLGLALAQILTLASGQIDVETANRAAPAPLVLLLFGAPWVALAAVGAVALMRQRHPLRWALLWWGGGPALLLTIPLTPSYVHYYVASLPALAALTACGVVTVLERLPAAPLRRALLGALLLLPAGHWAHTLTVTSSHPFSYPDFTTPLAYLLTVRDALAESDSALVVSDGMAWDLKHDVAVWHTLLRERTTCTRTLSDGYRLYPSGDTAVLIAPDGRASQNAAFYLAAAQGGFTLTARRTEPFTVLRLPPLLRPSPAYDAGETRFSEGAAFLGLDVGEEQVTLHWRITSPPTREADFQYTVQAYAADGSALGQRDGRFLHGVHWCAGDLLLIDVPLRLPAGTAELRVGLYQLGARAGEYVNLDWLDALGNAGGQLISVRLD